MMGAAYWYFTVNELGEKDMAAQLDHIDAIKRAELKESDKKPNEPEEEPQQQVRRPRYR